MLRGIGVGIAALLVVISFTRAAPAQQRNLPPGLLLVLEGYVGPRKPDDWGSNQLWLYDWHQKKSYQFQLQHLRVINSGVLPNQIIVTLTPNRPSLYLYGKKATVDALVTATPADQVTITGYTSPMSKLMVSEITVARPAATPSPSLVAPTPTD